MYFVGQVNDATLRHLLEAKDSIKGRIVAGKSKSGLFNITPLSSIEFIVEDKTK